MNFSIVVLDDCANALGCKVGKVPFDYIELSIGANFRKKEV